MSYLVWSNDASAWWGPNAHRYTQNLWEAGRYSHAEATRACGMRTWSLGKPPPEVMVLAPEHDTQCFTVDQIRDMPHLMRSRIDTATRERIERRDQLADAMYATTLRKDKAS